MNILLTAIDPGPTTSAIVCIDKRLRPVSAEIVPTGEVVDRLHDAPPVYVEMVASYGMPVGREVFDTVWWIGRICQARPDATLVTRYPVKLHHCHHPQGNDATIRQALVDRFAAGQPNHGKGTKASPGWFHGFKEDIWAAYALAVYAADLGSDVKAYEPLGSVA